MRYSVVEGVYADYKEVVISLLERNFEGLNSQRFAWIYENYPLGTPLIYLLRANSSGTFVGMGAMFPTWLYLNGERVKAYIAGDFVVNREHRSLAGARMLIRASVRRSHDEAPCVVLCVPNRKSGPVLARSGYKELAPSLELVKVIRTFDYLQDRLPSSWLAWILSKPFDAWLRLRSFSTLGFDRRNYRWGEADSVDQRCRLLQDGMRHCFSLLGHRDELYLNWRIKASPYGDNRFFTLTSAKTDELLGYLAFADADKRIDILDLGFDGDWGHFRMLIYLFIRHHWKKESHAIVATFAGGESTVREFRKLGFLPRGNSGQFMYYCAPSDMPLVDCTHAGGWFLTAADNDV